VSTFGRFGRSVFGRSVHLVDLVDLYSDERHSNFPVLW